MSKKRTGTRPHRVALGPKLYEVDHEAVGPRSGEGGVYLVGEMVRDPAKGWKLQRTGRRKVTGRERELVLDELRARFTPRAPALPTVRALMRPVVALRLKTEDQER